MFKQMAHRAKWNLKIIGFLQGYLYVIPRKFAIEPKIDSYVIDRMLQIIMHLSTQPNDAYEKYGFQFQCESTSHAISFQCFSYSCYFK